MNQGYLIKNIYKIYVEQVKGLTTYKMPVTPSVGLVRPTDKNEVVSKEEHVRIHHTYVREYSIGTDFSIRITRYDTQYVRILPRKLHETIHSTYGFPRTNYMIQYIVRREVSKSPRGPV